MKRHIQHLLKRWGLLERLRNSLVYDVYWGVADRRLLEKRSSEVRFYTKLLPGLKRKDLIFDVGANCGTKTDVFLRLGARVVAIEPDESNQEILREKFLCYRLAKKQVTVVGQALSDRDAVETMWVHDAGSALNTLSKKWAVSLEGDAARFGNKSFRRTQQVRSTTLERLFATYGIPYFVKIDVEGYEINVLRGMNRPVPFLSFEVNLPEFRPEGLQCLNILATLCEAGKFNYALDCKSGLVLDEWVPIRDFENIFKGCTAEAVEVFWKTPEGSDKS